MAVTSGQGHSRIIEKRRWEDYTSLKQYHQNSKTKEFIISGTCTTGGASAEICFVTGDVINYIAAQGQVYIRTEADDTNQRSKYVYIEYQDNTGAIKPILTADLNASNTTTEVAVTGATAFYRLRQMYSEVESASAGGKMVTLCDDDWDGTADGYGYISDGNSMFAAERYFVPSAATCKSYLGRVDAKSVTNAEAAAGFFLDITYTPKVVNLGEAQVAADITIHLEFNESLNWEPCIELQPATEVIFAVGDNTAAGKVFLEATFLEVYV